MIKYFTIGFTCLFLILAVPNLVLAHSVTVGPVENCPSGHIENPPFSNVCVDESTPTGKGTPFKFTLTNPGFTDLGPLLTILMRLAFAFAGIFFFAQILFAGIRWIGSGGDPKAVTAARDRATNAILGLVLVAATYAIILIIEKVLGIQIITGIKIS